jgi:hypothetical protein
LEAPADPVVLAGHNLVVKVLEVLADLVLPADLIHLIHLQEEELHLPRHLVVDLVEVLVVPAVSEDLKKVHEKDQFPLA